MAKTYGPLGPRGEQQDPAFLRTIALAALSRRRGPSGVSRPAGDFDAIGNPLAREKYARSFLDEKLRGMIAEREAAQAGTGLARRGMDLQAELGRGQLDLGRGGLEEQIRAEMAGEGLQGRRLGMEEQFGADRRLQGEREFGLGERGAGLAERSLEEQVRAALAGERLKGRELDVLETTGGSRDPAKVAEGAAINQQASAERQQALIGWIGQPGVQRSLGQLLRAKDYRGAIQFVIENNPVGNVSPDDVRRAMGEVIRQMSDFVASAKSPTSGINLKLLDEIMRQVTAASRGS